MGPGHPCLTRGVSRYEERSSSAAGVAADEEHLGTAGGTRSRTCRSVELPWSIGDKQSSKWAGQRLTHCDSGGLPGKQIKETSSRCLCYVRSPAAARSFRRLITEPFSSSHFPDLKNVDRLGQLTGTPRGAAELAQDPPVLEPGAFGALARTTQPGMSPVSVFLRGALVLAFPDSPGSG